jgi:uncharacterized protein YccT (UPF0319 family)
MLNHPLLFVYCTFIFASFFTSFSSHAAKLTIPDVFKVTKINGAEQSTSFFASENTFDVKEGKNIVVVQYSELFEDADNDDHVTIKSEPQMLLFTAEKNTHYILNNPKLEEDSQARLFAKKPVFSLSTTDNVSIEVFSQSTAEFEASRVFEQLEKNQLVLAQSQLAENSKTSVDSNLSRVNENSINESNAVNRVKVQSSVEALNMLEYWWQKADIEQRKAFMKAINH